MPQSFVSLHIHIVFSTKNRAHLIDEKLQQQLYDYIGGILRGQGTSLIAAGGMPDHIHLLCSLGKQTSVAEIVRTIKSNSSKWIHETFSERVNFSWQNGYGGFAVSFSHLEKVRKYISNQEEHHRTYSFQDELRSLMRRHNIPIDERYLWD